LYEEQENAEKDAANQDINETKKKKKLNETRFGGRKNFFAESPTESSNQVDSA
jgi:hypothetical protein